MAESAKATWKRALEVFDAVMDLPPAQQTAYLDRVCAGDDALREEVEALIGAEAEAPAFLGGSAADLAASIFPDLSDSIRDLSLLAKHTEAPPAGPDETGTEVGAYRLTRRLGYGGMGAVYLAERTDGQFEQRVAVKLLHATPTSAARLTRRLRAERQILAALNHPHIARVFDGGVTDDGRPYLVMEYVPGEPIDAFCDHHRLDLRARLRLFCQVAEAVQAAHRRLVVHRDLKPSNILVAFDDAGRPQAKLLDFGIAKLLADGGDLSVIGGQTLIVTQTGEQWMTPAYAAPEQVRGRPITTATDVYQLGVVLYELLTGLRPYDADPKSGAYGVARAVIENTPRRPSTLVAQTAKTARTSDACAARRADAPRELAKFLRGDLDTIVLKALSKAPEARYSSAEAFIRDIERYLDDRPVQASGDALRYRLGKFVQRHRPAVAAALLVMLLLVAYAAVVTVQLRHAAAERATQAAVRGFLVTLFDDVEPNADATALDLLDVGARRLAQGQHAGGPALRAELADVVGQAYGRLGAHDEAESLYRQTLRARASRYGARSLEAAAAHHGLGEALRAQGQLATAAAHHDTALAVRRARLGTGDALVAQSRAALGRVDHDAGRLARAETHLRAARATLDAARPPGDPLAARVHSDLGAVLRDQGRLDAAARAYRAALASYDAGGQGATRAAALAHHHFGHVQRLQGKHDAAEAEQRAALRIVRPIVSAGSPLLGYLLLELGRAQEGQGKIGEATTTLEEAQAQLHASLPPMHPRRVEAGVALGTVWLARDQPRRAAPLLREAARLAAQVYGDAHWRTAHARSDLGACLHRLGEVEAARTLLAGAHATLADARGSADALTREAQARLAALPRGPAAD